MSYDIDRDDEAFESLSEYYSDMPDSLEVVEGGPDPAQYSWEDEDRYLNDLDDFKDRLKTEQQAAMLADSVGHAAEVGVSRGLEFATDKDAKAAALREQAYKYAEPEDQALIDEAESLEQEWDENEARLAQAEMEGNRDDIEVCLSHRARISADLNALPRQVPSVERSTIEKGLEWQKNTLNWFNFSDSEKEQFLPDLKEAIRWSNASNAPFMVSLDPASGDLYRVECSPEISCAEQIRLLRADQRLQGVGEESLAYEANKRGILGGWRSARKITPAAKGKAKKEAEKATGDIQIVTGKGEVIETSREEKRPKRQRGPKPKTHVFSRL